MELDRPYVTYWLKGGVMFVGFFYVFVMVSEELPDSLYMWFFDYLGNY